MLCTRDNHSMISECVEDHLYPNNLGEFIDYSYGYLTCNEDELFRSAGPNF